MTPKELKKILRRHELWLEHRDGGERANLSGAVLSGADLSGANLKRAILSEANLSKADLSGANLQCANLSGAILSGANLSGASLFNANLYKVSLYKTHLFGTRLSGAKNLPYIPMACPDTGSFIGWKKAAGLIIKLEIPEDAKRSSATGRKCRCNKAKVLAIEKLDGSPSSLQKIRSNYTFDFIYRIGEIVEEPGFYDDRWAECAPGIHFFINRQEAVEYDG